MRYNHIEINRYHENVVFSFLSEFATLTGSALIDDIEPMDVDFFAKLVECNKEMEEKLAKLGAEIIDDGSCDDWGLQRRFALTLVLPGQFSKRIELFFVEPKYHSILVLITNTMKRMLKDRIFSAVLKDKEARVCLYESIRNSILNKSLEGKF